MLPIRKEWVQHKTTGSLTTYIWCASGFAIRNDSRLSPHTFNTFSKFFLCQSTICTNNSELWDVSGHNSEMRLLHFVTGFWCSLPMCLHEALLSHVPQHLQVHSELGKWRSTFTEKRHPAFLWDASDASAALLLGISLVLISSKSTRAGSSALYWNEVWPLTSFTFKCPEVLQQ